jgi:hypothetical protein
MSELVKGERTWHRCVGVIKELNIDSGNMKNMKAEISVLCTSYAEAESVSLSIFEEMNPTEHPATIDKIYRDNIHKDVIIDSADGQKRVFKTDIEMIYDNGVAFDKARHYVVTDEIKNVEGTVKNFYSKEGMKVRFNKISSTKSLGLFEIEDGVITELFEF